MKKRIFVCLMLAVCLVFAGCEEKEIKGLGRFEGLDPEIELQIIKDFCGANYKGQESVDYSPIRFYYGTYNGCVVIRVPGWGGRCLA